MKIDIENREPKREQVKEQIKDQKEQNREPKREQVKEQIKDQKEQKKEKNINNKEHPSIVKNFIGKEIEITLRNGTNLKGKLETVAQYELMITVSYTPIIVMKHAIDFITLPGEK